MKGDVRNRISLRRSAVKLISEIVQNQISVKQAIERSDESSHDRAWLIDSLSGYFRWKATIDQGIDRCLENGKLPSWSRRALGLAVFQMIDSKVDSRLIVNETVEMVKNKQGKKPSAFANAVLRTIGEKIPELRKEGPRFRKWVREQFCQDLGKEWTERYESQLRARPKLWIRSIVRLEDPHFGNPSGIEGAYLGGDFSKILKTQEFKEGKVFVQNISSQRAVKFVTEKLRDGPVLDLCSAPGGKALGLALNGLKVVATDISNERLERVVENRSRMGFSDEQIKIRPMTDIQFSDYQTIWIDAPCSSLGLLSHHPEIQWNRESGDLEAIETTQNQILSEVWGAIKPGTLVIYSVCSPLKCEGADMIAKSTGKSADLIFQANPFDDEFADGFWMGLITR